MSLIADFITLTKAGYGWLLLLAIGVWEVYAPRVIDRDTALRPVLHDLPEQVEDLTEKQEELRDDVDNVQEQNRISMQIDRAIARTNDDMDADAVDDYLLENGVRPDTFLTNDTDGRYRADGAGTMTKHGEEDTEHGN